MLSGVCKPQQASIPPPERGIRHAPAGHTRAGHLTLGLSAPGLRSHQLDDQRLGEQAYVVEVVVRVAHGDGGARHLPADRDQGAAALPDPVEQLGLPALPGQQDQPVVRGLGQVDVDMAPVAGVAADGGQARPLAQHQGALLRRAEPVRRCDKVGAVGAKQ
jgi:hypothetical protein